MRALVAALLLAGCGFDASGGGGGGGDDAIDGGGDAPVDAAPDLDAAPLPDAGDQPPECDAPWVQGVTGCHQYVKDVTATFDGAQADCQSRAGHLVVEDTAGEFEDVATGMAPMTELDRFWIGLSDPAPDDNVFVWVNGDPLTDTHWNGTEPSNSGDCVNARSTGLWGDRDCAELKWYVCEKND